MAPRSQRSDSGLQMKATNRMAYSTNAGPGSEFIDYTQGQYQAFTPVSPFMAPASGLVGHGPHPHQIGTSRIDSGMYLSDESQASDSQRQQGQIVPYQFQQFERMSLYDDGTISHDQWTDSAGGNAETTQLFASDLDSQVFTDGWAESEMPGSHKSLQSFHKSPVQSPIQSYGNLPQAMHRSPSAWSSRSSFSPKIDQMAMSGAQMMPNVPVYAVGSLFQIGPNDPATPESAFDLTSLDDLEGEDDSPAMSPNYEALPQDERERRIASGPPPHLKVSIDIDWKDEGNIPPEFYNGRRHPLFEVALKRLADGLYHCPFEFKGCGHNPTPRRCNAAKYVESHFHQYRCHHESCGHLTFSSNACKLRHEREEHGENGHGMVPYLCPYKNCPRSEPGNGFKRPYNRADHLRRIHPTDEEDKTPKVLRARSVTKQISKTKRYGKSTRSKKVTTILDQGRGIKLSPKESGNVSDSKTITTKAGAPISKFQPSPDISSKLSEWIKLSQKMHALIHLIKNPNDPEAVEFERLSARSCTLGKDLRENCTRPPR